MQVFPLGRPLHHEAQLAFTADGRYLGVEAYPFTLIDTLGGEPPVEFSAGTWESHYRFIRGGRAVASRSGADTLVIRDLKGGEVVTRKVDFRIEALAVGPEGDTLYIGGNELGLIHNEVYLLDANELTVRNELLWRAGRLAWLGVSADGQRLAGHDHYRIQILSLSRANPPVLLAAPRFIESFALSPDGSRCRGSPPRTTHSWFIESFALSPDGSRVAVGTKKGLAVWDAVSGAELLQTGKHRRGVTAVAWSPDSRLLATGDNGGLVFVWDADWRVVKRYEWGLTKVDGLAFSPDGLRCAAVGGELRDAKIVVWDVDV